MWNSFLHMNKLHAQKSKSKRNLEFILFCSLLLHKTWIHVDVTCSLKLRFPEWSQWNLFIKRLANIATKGRGGIINYQHKWSGNYSEFLLHSLLLCLTQFSYKGKISLLLKQEIVSFLRCFTNFVTSCYSLFLLFYFLWHQKLDDYCCLFVSYYSVISTGSISNRYVLSHES